MQFFVVIYKNGLGVGCVFNNFFCPFKPYKDANGRKRVGIKRGL